MADELTTNAETTRHLVALPRGDGSEEVRASSVVYRGSRFLSVRIWSRSVAGDHRPTARGIHLRPEELRPIRDALDRAIGSAEMGATPVR